MSWQERVDTHITLTSPTGALFMAYWTGNSRKMEKKLGIFELPRVQGAIVQDLDVGPVRWPIPIMFEGEDHDINADRFFTACKERGVWDVVHPVRGPLKLQLISVTEEIQPVTSGNVTQLETEWVEPGLNAPVASASMLAAKIYAMKDEIEQKQGAIPIEVKKPSLLAQIQAFIAKLQNVYSTIMGYYKMATDAIAAVVSTVTSLIGAITDLVSLPGMLLKDIKSRFKYFGDVLTATWKNLEQETRNLGALVGIGPSDKVAAIRNNVLVAEVVYTACMTGMAQSVIEADFKSREDALDYLEQFNSAFLTGLTQLDKAQAAFATAPIDQQYFGLADIYGELLTLVQLVGDMLLHRAFDLSVVKYITLQRDRAPVEIALTEGVDLDTFIAANQLSGTEILLLPAGRRVAVYL